MKTIAATQIFFIFLFLSNSNLIYSQNYLKEAIETKVEYVRNNTEEDKIAEETGWYKQMYNISQNIDTNFANKSVEELIPPYPNCSNARPLCLQTVDDYYLNVNSGIDNNGYDYDCLLTTPNPTWFYIKTTDSTNNITMTIGADNDIDFIMWGAFNDRTCNSSDLDLSHVVDCSYSVASVETLQIYNVVPNSYYMIMVTNYSNTQQVFHFQLDSGYLDCTPVYEFEGSVNVTGNVYFDDNTNCEYDTIENKIPNMLLKFSPGDYYVFTNDSGYYNLFLPAGDYTCEIINVPNDSNYYCIEDTLHKTSIYDTDTLNLPLFTSNTYDAYVNISCNSITSNSLYTINFSNHGFMPVNGEVIVTLDSALSVLSASEPYTVIDSNTISFSYSNLYLYENRQITIQVTPLNLVDYLGYVAATSVEITTVENDADLSNNTFTDYTVVQLPIDPNNIKASPFGYYEYNTIDTTDTVIVYTVNFQNTGTAPANNVRIYDTIPDYLDFSSVELLASSYENTSIYFIDSNVINISLPNINLIDSTHNEAESHGFVTFKLKTHSLNYGDTIKNFADIYFDTNPAVRTNTVYSIVSKDIPTNNKFINKKNKKTTIYPNPANSLVTIKGDFNKAILEVYSVDGTLITKENIVNNNKISIDKLKNGLYIFKITYDNNVDVVKLIKK